MVITSNTAKITVTELVWEDHFTGSTLNSRWITKGNVKLENGNLVLYGSGGSVRTNKINSYGTYEAKIKMCNVESYRSQFWMSGIGSGSPLSECMYEFNFEYGWCRSPNHQMGGNEKYIYLSRACDPNRQDINPGCGQSGEGCWSEGGCTGTCTRKAFQCKYTDGTTMWGNDWHIYTLEWAPTYMKWYIDGIQVCTTTYGVRQVLDDSKKMDLHFAMWKGPGWPCNNTTTLGGLMQVDYVKVYKK